MAKAVARIDQARSEGVDIAANMYAYTAGATGLTAALPPWVQAGGHDVMIKRLKDPAIRQRVIAEMKGPAKGWKTCANSQAMMPRCCSSASAAKP